MTEREKEKKRGKSVIYGLAPIAATQLAYLPGSIAKATDVTSPIKSFKFLGHKIVTNTRASKIGGGGAYDPESKLVHIYRKGKGGELRLDDNFHFKTTRATHQAPLSSTPIAHEIGHKLNNISMGETVTKAYVLNRHLLQPAGLLGSILTATAKDDKDSRNIAIGSSIPGGITLGEEMIATGRGLNLVRKHLGAGEMMKHMFHSSMGLPSYAAFAAAPAITYFARKKLMEKKSNLKGDTMNNEEMLEKIAEEAFNDELQKIAGGSKASFFKNVASKLKGGVKATKKFAVKHKAPLIAGAGAGAAGLGVGAMLGSKKK